jgi:triphosphoribosyl-dephospho-CoA synthase
MNRAVEEEISSIAIEAMLHEVAATPKPGLVDRLNSGAHSDMNIFTFFSSTAVIQPYFVKMATKGSNFSGEDFTDLLKELRPIGTEAERAMFKATNGVNTHKGLIFSLGILVCASAYLIKNKLSSKAENICHSASLMCSGIVNNELENLSSCSTTGERLFKSEGIKGIRGEAESGFASVLNISLPYLRKSVGNWN